LPFLSSLFAYSLISDPSPSVKRAMKLFQFILLCFAAVQGAGAFAPKKRGESSSSTRPAFKAHHAVVKEEECTAAQTCNDPPPFAFKATPSSEAVMELHDDELDFDDDVVIGTATGIVACAVSLALGFSLGYVTL
jgi:hypothetical protein